MTHSRLTKPHTLSIQHKLLALAVAQAMISAASAATITVNSLADTTSDDGSCSLREALASATSGMASGLAPNECVAGEAGADTIEFDPAILPGTITLDGTELTIDSAVTIQGPGSDQLTISGANTSRIFNIYDGMDSFSAPPAAVALDGLTLANGSTGDVGGAISSLENLTVSNSTLSGNSASLGGAIYGSPNITVNDSTLSGNSANSGGGIVGYGKYYAARISIINSTLSGNSANFDGGGIRSTGQSSATINIANSTLSGNSALRFGGAIEANAFGTIAVTNSTLSGNSALRGGGIAAIMQNSFALTNSVIANTADGGDCYFGFALATLTNSISEDGSCGGPATAARLDPDLKPNGGSTLTHAIRPGSPLIDSGDPSSCASLTTDQTGMPRPIDGDADGLATCDIGAVEFVDIFSPEATLISGPVVAAGAASDTIVVEYTDDAPIDLSSLGAADIGLQSAGSVQGHTVTSNDNGGREITVTYSLVPPGGSWDAVDNGDYTILLNPNEISDTATTGPNTSSESATFGAFGVALAEIDLSGNGISIADGDSTPNLDDGTDFGDLLVNEMATHAFTLSNTGLGVLNIGIASISGDAAFTVSQPAPTMLGPSESASFDVTFNPSNTGAVGATVTIINDDGDENPYTFEVQGAGLPDNAPPVAMDATFTVFDGADNGSVVGQVAATDPDNNIPETGAWQITAGNPDGAYAIGDDGTITVADNMAISAATLTTQVTDDGGLSDTATITIATVGEAIFSDGFEGP